VPESRRSYLYCGFTTTLNIILFVLSFGKFLWLEGRVSNGRFTNWLKREGFRPQHFVQPSSEQELIDVIKRSSGIRVFGSGHSFNSGVVADNTLISLDNYSGILHIDKQKKLVTVKGGTRVRDISRALLKEGFAFGNLPSHDAQSIGGIISTDVHGTGRDWGFVSEAVVSFKLIDGNGQVHVCKAGDDLFKAAIGGIGAVGIISEVVLEVVDHFNLEQKVEMSTWPYVQSNLDKLIAKDEHMSLYLFPFTDKCQINSWNATQQQQSFLGPLREFLAISVDALLAAWFGNLMSYLGLLPKLSNFTHGLKRGTSLVMESYKGFNRTIYHLHQELEFAVPYERTVEVCEKFIELFEKMYATNKLPYTLFEIRFTPGGHEGTLVGPGRERRTMWLDLLANDSHGFEEYFAEAEKLMREVDARPHPGKFNDSFTSADLKRFHGQHFDRFIALAKQHDPHSKFTNPFTRRLFGL
jgi:FAD/FMN-containing dehydrogenase